MRFWHRAFPRRQTRAVMFYPKNKNAADGGAKQEAEAHENKVIRSGKADIAVLDGGEIRITARQSALELLMNAQ